MTEIAQRESALVAKIAASAVAAAGEVFETMMKMTPTAQAAGFVAHTDMMVSGIIGLTSDRYKINTIVHFPADLAARATAAMLGVPVSEIEQNGVDVQDAVGEIANMMAGRVKNRMLHERISLAISLPSVVSGREFVVGQCPGAQHFRYRLGMDGGACWLEVAVVVEGAA